MRSEIPSTVGDVAQTTRHSMAQLTHRGQELMDDSHQMLDRKKSELMEQAQAAKERLSY